MLNIYLNIVMLTLKKIVTNYYFEFITYFKNPIIEISGLLVLVPLTEIIFEMTII